MVNFTANFENFSGSGFAPTPAAGQLDSDIWRVTGLSDGSTTFGGTFDSGDFARGTDANGGVSTGGVYAFDVSGNTFIGLQPGGSDVTPGTVTLKLTNDTGSAVTSIDVSYDIMVNNDQDRANSMNLAWSLDDTTYNAVAALDYTSPEASDALGFQAVARSTTLTGFTLADGESMYIQWQTDDVSGGGSRDELGLDNISVTVPSSPAPSGPTDLFFSEYVEGSSNNKALEIFNGTGAAIDLATAGYSVEIYFNGSTTPGTTIALTGTVADGDVFVLADDGAAAAILAETDQTSTKGFFNGDDAVVLKKNGTIIDVIGQIGTDPGSEWSGGGIGTQNETLRRDASVLEGDDNGADAFDPSVEWTGFAQDTFDGLGSHTTDAPGPLLNEVLGSTTGPDSEFVEIFGTPGFSLDGLSLIIVEGDNPSGPGSIDRRIDFDASHVIGGNGFFLLSNDLVPVTPDLEFAQNYIENSAYTIALVETSSISGNTVTGSEVVVDAVGVSDAVTNPDDDNTFFFGAPVVGPDGDFLPAGFVRTPDGGDKLSIIDFNNFAAESTPTAGTPVLGASNFSITGLNAVKAEGDVGTTPFTFTVTRSGDTTSAMDVDYAVSGADVDGADFGGALPSGTVSFAAGETSKLLTVQVSGDQDVEFDEDFTVTLSNPTGGATISTAAATGTIQTDDVGITAIHDIQGATDTSPLVGQTVTVEAVVVGDFQDGDADASRDLRGFYLQEEDADVDGNLLTSEGLFVFDGSTPLVDVNVGDVVQVTGTVSEFFGETQLSSVSKVTVISSGATLPTASVISLPTAAVTTNQDGDFQPDLEAYEGMLVTFGDELTISEMYQLDRFNEIKLIQGGREHQFTQTNEPDALAYNAFLQDVGARTITYDDGLSQQNALIGNLDGFGPTFSSASDIRMGDTITDLSGVLSYQWAGNSASGATWRVRSTVDGENSFDKESVRPTDAPDVGGSLKVTSFNVLNFFATLDDGPTTALGLDPRGADSQAEYDRQLEKLGTAILEMDADILGLVEIENDFLAGASGNAIEQLVAYLNAQAGAGTYDWVDPGTRHVGGDAIAVGVIYKPALVQIAPGTTVEVLTDSDLPALGLDGIGPIFDGAGTNRAPLAVTFEQLSNGATVTVAVTHMKSKGSEAPGAGNADLNDGVATSNQMRVNGVTALNTWLDTDPTGSGDDDILLLGDFNAYAKEDPISYLETEGFTDLVGLFVGPDAYSFVFDGLTGTLDYAFANEPLTAQITGTSEWSINADEPDAIDYNLDFGKDASIFDGTEPFRTSDHDPVIVGLALNYEGLQVADSGDTRAWDNYIDTFSGIDGSRIQRVMEFDDGRITTIGYDGGEVRSRVLDDVGDAYAWTQKANSFDAAGVLTSRVTTFDDGRTATNTYVDGQISLRVVEDTDDAFTWDTIEIAYAGGERASHKVSYDDGRLATTTFADGIRTSHVIEDLDDVYDWHQIEKTFDAVGNLVDKTVTLDVDLLF